MQGMDAMFFLANRFPIREKAKLQWSIHTFKLAHQLGIKLFQFSSLDYLPNKAGFDPKFHCAHYDTKGHVSGAPSVLFSLVWPVAMQPAPVVGQVKE
jgi:hypothetical protein